MALNAWNNLVIKMKNEFQAEKEKVDKMNPYERLKYINSLVDFYKAYGSVDSETKNLLEQISYATDKYK